MCRRHGPRLRGPSSKKRRRRAEGSIIGVRRQRDVGDRSGWIWQPKCRARADPRGAVSCPSAGMEGRGRGAPGQGALLGTRFLFVKDRFKGPPTANHQPPPTTNHHQPPTTNRRQPAAPLSDVPAPRSRLRGPSSKKRRRRAEGSLIGVRRQRDVGDRSGWIWQPKCRARLVGPRAGPGLKARADHRGAMSCPSAGMEGRGRGVPGQGALLGTRFFFC